METTLMANLPSFDAVWASLQETDRLFQELREDQKETERILRASAMDFNRKLGKFANFFGEFTEYTIAPKLCEKFLEFGFDFSRANRHVSVNDRFNQIFFEIDIMLENGDKAMLVEVKTKLTAGCIHNHIHRLEKMRNYADFHSDKRTFLGAVAGVEVTDETRNYALNEGFYVIEPAKENFNITSPNGSPKRW